MVVVRDLDGENHRGCRPSRSRARDAEVGLSHARNRFRSIRSTGYTLLVTKASVKLLTEALALTVDERMELAAELLASVDGPPDPDWEEAWQAELDRRAAKSDATDSPAAEWSEVRARVLSKLASR